MLVLFYQDDTEIEIIRLTIDSGTGSPIPVLVRRSNMANADRAVHLLFIDADLSFQSNGVLDISACFETEKLYLHFLGHQNGTELQLYRFAGSPRFRA
jgi:hypothetical protein